MDTPAQNPPPQPVLRVLSLTLKMPSVPGSDICWRHPYTPQLLNNLLEFLSRSDPFTVSVYLDIDVIVRTEREYARIDDQLTNHPELHK